MKLSSLWLASSLLLSGDAAVISPTPQIANSTVILLTGTTATQGPWTKGCDPAFGVMVTSGPKKGWCEDSIYINNANYRELNCTQLHEASQPNTVYTSCYYRPK